MQNIIIFGPAGAGKTTAANMIAEMTGQHRVVSLGDKIKEIQRELHYNDEQMRREEQQGVGQGLRCVFGDKVWCEYLWSQHRLAVTAQMVNLVIDDGRQYSELDYWRGKGFLALGIGAQDGVRAERLIKRDGYDQRDRFGHETEVSARMIALNDCSYYIYNNGTLDRLRDRVQALVDVVNHV